MIPVRILVDSLADADLPNAQMGNAREIICRLDPERFYVSVFSVGKPDPRIKSRRNTKIIFLPARRQTLRILQEFIFGSHEILFYVKAAPAAVAYMKLRKCWNDRKAVVGTFESQSDLQREPTITKATIRMWEQTILRSDYLFANSTAVKEGLATEYGLPSEIVPTGVDTRFFAPDFSRAPNVRLQVLHVGSLRAFKQPNAVLDAAARHPQADFVLAGDGNMTDVLRDRVAQQKLTNVYLLGCQTSAQLRDLYRRSDLFLFPSLWEGSPKVILEAAACGLPVIARNNYRPETVVDGVTGFLVSSDADLFSRLEQLLSRGDLRQSFGGAARLYSERFDWDVITPRWEQIFSRVRHRRDGGRHES